MSRLARWIGGAVGGILAYRFLKRRNSAPVGAPAFDDPDARAEELRAKLAESRASDEQPPAPPDDSLEERRRKVHEEGRAAIDRMTDG